MPPTPVYSGITDLLVNPLDSSVVYAGVSGRGAFRSSDGGASWSEFNPDMAAQTVMQLIVGPGSVVYAGTSHGLFRLVTP